MKVNVYSLNQVIQNIKKNRRTILIIFCFCILVGIICGFINNKKLDKTKYGEVCSSIEAIEINSLQRNEEYFYKVYRLIQGRRNELNAYIQYLSQVRMGQGSREKLEEIEEKLLKCEEQFIQFEEYYINQVPIIHTKATENYIRKMFMQRILNLNFEGKKQYAIKEFEFWERMQNNYKVHDSKERMLIESIMDDKINTTVNMYNELTIEFNEVMNFLEEEELYVIEYNTELLEQFHGEICVTESLSAEAVMEDSRVNALIYARSIPRVDDKKEAFVAYFVFFLLFGFICSILFGAFWNKNNK